MRHEATRITDMCRRRRGFRSLLTCAAFAALLPLSACVVPAQLSPGDGRAYEVSLAYIGGRPAVAWYGGTLQHEAIFLRHANEAGRPRGPILQLTDATRDAYEPSLQQVGGDALVAWYEQVGDRRSGGVQQQIVLLARFDAQGKPRWRRQLSAEDAKSRIPVVRAQGDIIHVAWVEQRTDAVSVIRVASLDATGQWLHKPRDAAPVGSNTWNLNAMIGDDGTLHVLYDAQTGTAAKELHWLRVRGDRIEEQRISADDGNESAYPDIALHGSRVAVTWFDSRDGNEEVYLRCASLDAYGAPPPNLRLDDGAAVRVSHTPGSSIGAYLIWHGDTIELAWSDVNGEQRTLYVQSFDRHCQAKGAPQELAGARGAAGIPSLASSPTGFAVAWDEQRRNMSTQGLHGHSRRIASVVRLRTWREAAKSTGD